jgi:hypothetical protein
MSNDHNRVAFMALRYKKNYKLRLLPIAESYKMITTYTK